MGNDWETADKFWPAAQQYMIEHAISGMSIEDIKPLTLISEPKASLALVKLIHMAFWRTFKQKVLSDWHQDFSTALAVNDRFRIGILSGDFYSHVSDHFINGWIQHYDRTQFTLSCYANVPDKKRDHITEGYRQSVDHFIFVDKMSPLQIAEQIKNDGIHILVDLTGYNEGSLLEILLYKPAPIIMTWLGYPCTTGFAEVDYVIGDRWLYTPRHSELFVEKMLVLENSCYFVGNYPRVPPQALLPVNQNGYITFGSLMHAYKINPDVIAVWRDIIGKVKNAKLVLKHPKLLGFPLENLLKAFNAQGFPMDRLTIVSAQHESGNHLSHYLDIDITLDTFPQTGGTTTLDSLSMGVPVISLVGDAYFERISYSLIQNSGLSNTAPLIAFTIEEYVEKAVALAEDRMLLNRIHDELIQNLRNSHIFSAKEMTRELEAGFRQAWHETLSQHVGKTPA
jgi:predicted O-linked N-acetylglucosamine transferase (SPINDLY family)